MYRIGNSIDIHPLSKGAKLRIGGVEVPAPFGSISHSDGDALSHSIAEAILGALGQGDLGQSFSDKDEKYRGISSLYFLKVCKETLANSAYKISNIDTMIVLEEPKLGSYKEAVRESVAKALGIEKEKVNIKAGTNEGIGSIGNKKAYLVWTTVLLEKEEENK
ncbi:2-C-methyl-D-erythritol 2,4-cyclodiphosphate synthase [bacterium]|nr:2-C-methyl-D-erythritol 2,4-cyclodiphosphate synthase [bacterium]